MRAKITKIIELFFLSIVILFLIAILSAKINNRIPKIFGYKFFVILSGSMQKGLNVGDLILIKEVDFSTLKEGDIITFYSSEGILTTHRIVDSVDSNDKKCFITKGDANNTIDEGTVCLEDVEGKYILKIVGLGSLIMFLQKPLVIMIILIVILSAFLGKKFIFDYKQGGKNGKSKRNRTFNHQKLS